MATLVDTLQVKFEAIGDQFERETNRLFGPRGILIAASAAAGAAVVAAMAKMSSDGIKQFAAFEHSMAGAFRNIGNTSAEMETELTDGVRRIATEYGISATEIAEALAEYAYAGLEVEDALWSVETATRGAIAADSDLMDTLNKMEGIWAAFKGQGYEVEEVMDILTTMTSNAVGGFEALTGAVVGAAAPAMNTGVSLEELGGFIGALTWLGVDAAEASTRVRTALQELGDSGSAVGERFKELTGVTFKEFIAAGGTLQEALGILKDNLKDGEDFSTLFGSSIAGNAVDMVAAGEGAAYYAQILDSLEDSTGATDAAFERMSGTIESKGKTIRAQFQEMSIALGERLAPMVHAVQDAVIEAFPKIQETVLGVFDKLGAGVQTVINWWQSLVSSTDTNWSVAAALTESFHEAMGKVFELLGILWTGVLRPIWDGIAPHFRGIWEGVVTILRGAWSVINGILDVFIGFLTGDWERAWAGMQAMVDGVWQAVQGVVQVAWEAIAAVLDAAINLLGGPLTVAWEFWRDVADGVWASVVDATTSSWDAIKGILETAIEFLSDAFGAAWETLGTFISGVWTGIIGTVKTAWGAIRAALAAVIQWLADTFQVAFDALGMFLAELWDRISSNVTEKWDAIKGTLTAVTDWLASTFQPAWDALSGFFSGLWATIQGNLSVAWEAIKTVLSDVWNSIAGVATTAWSAVVDAILGAFDGMVATLQGVWEGVVNTVKNAINSVIESINSLISAWNGVSFSVPSITLPRVDFPDWLGGGTWGGDTIGGQEISVPQIPTIPMLASGGIVDSATLAMIGEAGPEAVIPLDKLDRMLAGTETGGNQTIIVELDGYRILQAIAPRMVDEIRVRTGLRGI